MPAPDHVLADSIRDAVDHFRMGYHEGFREVRMKAQEWLAGSGPPTQEMVDSIRKVLGEWGAGLKKAPTVADDASVVACLESNRSELQEFGGIDLWSLQPAPHRDKVRAQLLLRRLLWNLSGCFNLHRGVRAPSVTYPSKLLMLLTGRYVGLDSNVRSGLHRAWREPGFTGTQFLLPQPTRECAEAERILRVFGRMTEYLWKNRAAIEAGISASSRPEILSDLDAPGRIVDIVLFEAGR